MSRRDLHQEIRGQFKIINAIFLGVAVFIAGILAAFFMLQPPSQTDLQPDTGALVPVKVDYPAPELSAQSVYGNSESLNDYRGKVVLVNFWATWCPPCQAEMPMLVDFYNAHADEGFVLVSINVRESGREIADFVRRYKMTFPVWLDPNGNALSAFKNQVLPSSYAIDRMGVMRFIWAGAVDQETLEAYIIPLIDEN